jgi:predicted component of type VI protein secretion system
MAEFTTNLNQKQQGFIIEERDESAASVADIPNNRTMFVANLSGKPASRPELAYDLETMDDVFAHYKPEVKVEYQDELGRSIRENLTFRSLGDFTKKAYVERCNFLRLLDRKQKDHLVMAKRLQNNRMLHKVLNDPEKKKAYLDILKKMLDDLEAG